MVMLVDITPTNIQFLFNGKPYQITEIMEGSGGLMITAKESKPEEKPDELLEPNN